MSDILAILNAAPGAYVVLMPDAPKFTIIAVTDAYLLATFNQRKEIIGRGIFEATSGIPEFTDTSVVANLRALLTQVLEQKVPNSGPGGRHGSMATGNDGLTKIWKWFNKPVLNVDGAVQYIIHSIEDVTATSNDFENMKEEHRRLQEAQAIGRIGSFEWTLGEEGVAWSDEMFHLNGMEPQSERINIDRTEKLVYPDDFPKVKQLKKTSFSTPGKYEITHRILLDDGTLKWVIHRFESVADEAGDVIRVHGTLQDVTAQKKAEQVSKENEGLLKTIFDASPNMVSVFEILYDDQRRIDDFKIVMQNPAALKVIGDRNVIGQRYSEAFPNVVKSGLLQALKNVAQSGEPADFEKWYEGEGMHFWIRIIANKIGNLLVVATEDITTRKRNEQEIRQSRDLLQNIIDAPTVGMAVYKAVRDAQGRIVDFRHEFINRITRETLNRDFIGKLLSDYGEAGMSQLPKFIEVIETGKTNNYILRVEFNEKWHWVSFSNTSLDGDRLVHTWEDITERKEAEQELLQVKEELAQKLTDKYSTLFNSIDEGFSLVELIFDKEGAVVDYWYRETNPLFKALTGIEDAVGRRVSEVISNLEPEWFQKMQHVYHTGEPARLEYPVKGVNRWFTCCFSRVGGEGSPLIAAVYNDITEQINSKKKIEESEKQFRSVLLQSPNIFMILKGFPEMIITFANEPLFKSWGRTAEIIGKPLLEVVPELKDQPFPKIMQQVFETGETYTSSEEKAVIIKNGVPVDTYYVYAYQAIFDDDQIVTGVTIMATDITPQVEARITVEESEQRLRLATEASNIYWWEFNFETNVTRYSSNTEQVMGAPPAKTIEENLLLIHPDDRGLSAQAFEEAIKNGSNLFNYVVRSIALPHEIRWMQVSGQIIRDNYNSPVLAVGVTQNITERKHNEANLAFLAEVSQDLVRLTNIDETMIELGEKIGMHFNVASVVFAEISEDQQTLDVIHQWDRADLRDIKGSHTIKDYFSPEFERLQRAGEIAVIRDTANDQMVDAKSYDKIGIGSFVAVPLTRENKWHFYFSLLHTEARDWTADEIELMREITTRIWTRLERARAEEALRQSEEKYRTLFESIDEGFCIIELIYNTEGKASDFTFYEVNPAFQQQTRLVNAAGKRAMEIVPNTQPFSIEQYQKVLETGNPIHFESFTAADNRWYQVSATRIGKAGSQLVAILFDDITERKKADERQHYLLKLSDALKELTDPIEVQLNACKILGEHVKVNRVLYGEVINEEQVIVTNNYVHGVPPIIATLDAAQFGKNVINAFKRNEKIIFSDIKTNSEYTEDEKQSFLSLDVMANAGMGLLKGGRWVATIGMHCNVPKKWTETEIWLLEETAERTWAAVERAKAEQALRKSEEKYRNELQLQVLQRTAELKENKELLQTVFDASPNSISVYETLYNEEGEIYDFKILIFNAFTLKTIGGRDVVGQNYSEAFPHVIESGVLKEFIKVATTGEQTEFEKWYDGEGMRHWFRFIATRIDKRLLVTTEDITVRKKAEEEIRTHLTLLKQSEDLAQIGSWEYDINTSAFTWSEGMYRLFNIQNGLAVRPEIYLDFVVDEDRSTAKRILDSFKKPQTFEETLCINANGIIRELKIKASILNDEKGIPQKLVGVDLDISEVKQRENTLKEQAHFIKSTNEALPDILYVLNLNTKQFLYINHSFEKRLGYLDENETQKSILDLLYHEDVPIMLRHLEEMKTIPDGIVREIEYRLKAADGKLHWFRDRNSVFKRTNHGITIEKIGIAQDVTARKKGEQALKESNMALRYANENLQQFASIASHDLQEPLRKLKLFASVLQRYDKEMPGEAKELIQKISRTSARMRQLITEVLQYSRVAYGAKEFVRTELHSIFQNVLDDLDLLISETGASIEYNQSLPVIDAIPLQMNQLFYNLITNALKFRKDGIKPVARILYRMLPIAEVKSYSELNADKPHLEIQFSDNGVGFNQMYARQIFGLFERLYSTDEYEGTGVGLALCKKIAENHHGHIFAKSSDGEGATFYILLPVSQTNNFPTTNDEMP